MCRGIAVGSMMLVVVAMALLPAHAERALNADELRGVVGGQLQNHVCVPASCGTGMGCCMRTDLGCTPHQQCSSYYSDCQAKVANTVGVCVYSPGSYCTYNQNLWCIWYQGGHDWNGECACDHDCGTTYQMSCPF